MYIVSFLFVYLCFRFTPLYRLLLRFRDTAPAGGLLVLGDPAHPEDTRFEPSTPPSESAAECTASTKASSCGRRRRQEEGGGAKTGRSGTWPRRSRRR